MGQILRSHLVHPNAKSSPDLDSLLFTALRAEGARQILDVIRSEPAMTIVLERWSLALSAYGRADEARPELVRELRKVLDDMVVPDVTLLLNADGHTAHSRLAPLGNPNRFESRGAEYLDVVADHYRELAETEDGVHVVDASGAIGDTWNQVQAIVNATWPDLHA